LKKLFGATAFGLLLLAILGRAGAFAPLLNANYLPHRFCYLAQPGLIWTNVAGDSLIAVSYALLFGCLLWITLKLRAVVELRDDLWIFLSFGLFIAACGATHLMEVVTVWLPVYPFSAAVKLLCAAASVPTAILFARAAPALVHKIPQVLQSLSTTQQERDQARAELLARDSIAAERERAETIIHEAYTRMNHIMDSTSEGIIKLRPDWSVVYANRQALETIPDLRLDESYWDCFPGVRGTPLEEYLQRTMRDRQPTQFENFWEPYGEWYAVHCYPTEGGMSVFFMPITARKRLEQKLNTELQLRRRQEQEIASAHERLNHILDSTSEGVMMIDRYWTVLYTNRRAQEISPELKLGMSFWECYPSLQGSHVETHLRSCIADQKETQYELYYPPYDAWFSARAFPTPRGISLFYRSITVEKKMAEQLEFERKLREKRIEALSHMAGGLAHEISNPLAIIHATASDLQRAAQEEGLIPVLEALKASETIVKTSDRAIRILRGLRGFAREAENDPMELASIPEIVSQAIEMQEARFERHGISLRSRLPASLPRVLCREIQIGQIITNLLNNAYDAIVEQNCAERWVLLEIHNAGDLLEVTVTDSGMGVEENAREHLMDPFFTTKTRGLGMGVGLSLSRAIAHDHGGSLTLCNDTEHTCFCLTLPVPAESDHPALQTVKEYS
jgi:signal transduction histidine kinase/PAS domain-containing protein